MALQKQQFPVSFAGGIDTKTDDKQVLATKLLELENGIFTKKGKIKKRNGYDLLSTLVLEDASSLSAATGISVFKNELIFFSGTTLYSYAQASEAWITKGKSSSVTISNKSILRNNFQQSDQDYGYNSGFGCYVWADTRGGVRYSIVDEVTGSFIVSDASLSNTGISPRVIGVGQYFFIYYIEGTAIKFRSVQTTAPELLSAASDLTTTVNGTNKIYDAQLIGDRVYIAYNTNNGASSVSIFYQLKNKVISDEVEAIGQVASKAVSIASDGSNNIWLSWANAVNLKYIIYDYNLNTTVLATTVIETVGSIRNLASTVDGTTGTFLYEKTNSPDNFVRKNTGTLTGTVGTASVFVRSVGLGSKFFSYNSQKYITFVHSSTLQSTYFVYSLTSDIITKINENIAGGYTSSSILPTVVEQSTGKFSLATLKKGVLQAENGVLFTAIGISSTIIDFVSLNNFITAQLGNNLHIVGGILQTYDGLSVVESGFNQFPEGVTATEVNLGAGAIANGFYEYAVVYGWTDNQGQIHRSAPSIPTEITIAGGPSDVSLTVPTLRISKKQNVFIEIYRTEKDGDIFYKITSNTSLTPNDSTVDTITYVDTKTDAQLVSGELLYTTGGVLENIAPPSSSAVVNWKNRIVVKSSDEPNLLWISKLREEGKPVEFSDALTISVDPIGGDITAVGVLDDKLIIFKDQRIHAQAGDGPNNLGQQSDFGLPQLITADAGCVDVNSIVETPVGLMFKSKKGIYLLNRGLQAQYIGAEVEKYNSSRITAAQLVPDANQVRFTTEDNVCLVYDYFFSQWSTFTNHEAVGATLFQEKFTFVKSNGQVFQENSDVFTDGMQAVKLRLVSSWMQLGNLIGFQRIYKFLLLGSYKSAHRLKVSVGFEYNDNFTQEVIINPETVFGLTTYGEDSPYGSETVYGGEFPLYEWRIFPKRQKCQSFRIAIEDVLDSVFGESFDISAMRLEIGVKEGSNKVEVGKSYSTS